MQRTNLIDVIGRRGYSEIVDAASLTIGIANDYQVMLDGYHRAAIFWKIGPSNGKLLAYLPR
jgi:hypothetical protein